MRTSIRLQAEILDGRLWLVLLDGPPPREVPLITHGHGLASWELGTMELAGPLLPDETEQML